MENTTTFMEYLVYVRADTAPNMAAQWYESVREVLTLPDVREKLGRAGYDLLPGGTLEEVARHPTRLPRAGRSGCKGD